MRELAAEKFDEAAGARAAVSVQQAHAVEKNPQIEDVHVLEDGGTGAPGLLLLDFGDEGDQRGVEFTRERRFRGSFVDDAGAERFIRSRKCLDGGEDVGIRGRGLGGAELGDRESQRGHQLLVRIDDILRNFFIEEGSVRGKGALVPVFVPVGRDQIGAIGGASDCDFALGSAANGANFFTLGRAETLGFALFADRAGHGVSSEHRDNSAEYAARQ